MEHKLSVEEQTMFAHVDQLLAEMQLGLQEIRTVIFVLAKQAPDPIRDQEMQATLLARIAQMQNLMSGRWHRRDGDAYGIVRQPGVSKPEPLPDGNG